MHYQEQPRTSYVPDEKEYMMNPANIKSLPEITKTQRALYPEVLYKLEPFIASTCDAIRSAGIMPNQQEIDDITDEILDDFLKMHPEMERYMNARDNENDMPEAVPAQVFPGGFRRGGDSALRSRGSAGLITFVLQQCSETIRTFLLSLLLYRAAGRGTKKNPVAKVTGFFSGLCLSRRDLPPCPANQSV